MIQKILIANRGEIVIRIAKTCRELGISTVAIYSEADRDAPHRVCTDESYLVGAAPASQSYLNQKRILEIATSTGCDAIHPGYGFLSENANFAQAVQDEKLIFIGPGVSSMRLMGDKLAAKQLALEQGIPLLPGSKEPFAELAIAENLAENIGYPVLIKAAGGGGGKGMRIVQTRKELAGAFKLATSEAKQSFGDPRVFIEKYLKSPKHIEIQVMADVHGNVVHVFERDCSIQRRHQKVVEESPAPSISESLRAQMTAAAIKITKACHYHGAGTLEFLVDGTDNFYFLEMNTRLQVEHPVTESISGLDLVKWQIDIANGLPLPARQQEIKVQGHSIELRIYAEDPLDQFNPSLGIIEEYNEPSGAGIRVDSGIKSSYEIPIFYDPMLAKLIVFAATRERAIARLRSAIKQYDILGTKTTLAFGLFVCEHPDFISGNYDTSFVQKHFNKHSYQDWAKDKSKIAAMIAASLRKSQLENNIPPTRPDNWWVARKWGGD